MEGLNNSNTTTTTTTSASSIMSLSLPLDSFASVPVQRATHSDIQAVCFAEDTAKGLHCYVYSTCMYKKTMNTHASPLAFDVSRLSFSLSCKQRTRLFFHLSLDFFFFFFSCWMVPGHCDSTERTCNTSISLLPASSSFLISHSFFLFLDMARKTL